MTDTSAPKSVTGGCLCGAIRYTIRFDNGARWPPDANGTCQCTMCRKWTGCLVPQSITVPTKNIEPKLSSWPATKQYQSSATASRSFCGECGSSLTYNTSEEPDNTEIWLGTIDEEVLLGKKVPGSERKTERGIEVKREDGLGTALCTAMSHIWFVNAIPGVTDKLRGPKYLQDQNKGVAFE